MSSNATAKAPLSTFSSIHNALISGAREATDLNLNALREQGQALVGFFAPLGKSKPLSVETFQEMTEKSQSFAQDFASNQISLMQSLWGVTQKTAEEIQSASRKAFNV